MPAYRSRVTTHGRNMAGARALWRATGMTDTDFCKPIIAVANSFTQFVPGHVHLKDLGQLVRFVDLNINCERWASRSETKFKLDLIHKPEKFHRFFQ
ncbi:hypothetical protein CCP3SC5AM1_940009 [Gammaproteobacteria bacterium]